MKYSYYAILKRVRFVGEWGLCILCLRELIKSLAGRVAFGILIPKFELLSLSNVAFLFPYSPSKKELRSIPSGWIPRTIRSFLRRAEGNGINFARIRLNPTEIFSEGPFVENITFHLTTPFGVQKIYI